MAKNPKKKPEDKDEGNEMSSGKPDNKNSKKDKKEKIRPWDINTDHGGMQTIVS